MAGTLYDLDVLRTFSTGIALGSFSKAADRLGRSTSAVSAQLKRLEEQSDTPLLRRAGRGLELTAAGETLLSYAHRMLDLNEEARMAVRSGELEGSVRIGLQEDLGEAMLAQALGRFTRAHPRVRIEACVARSSELRERLELGQLDLALSWDVGMASSNLRSERLLQLPMQWIGPARIEELDASWWTQQRQRGQARRKEPLPLVLLDMPCPVRAIVTSTLEQAGIAWRLAFTSASLSALWAATGAGLGLTVRTSLGLPTHVRAIDRANTALPRLGQISLVMSRARAEPEPAVGRLAALFAEVLQQPFEGTASG